MQELCAIASWPHLAPEVVKKRGGPNAVQKRSLLQKPLTVCMGTTVMLDHQESPYREDRDYRLQGW